MTAKKFSNALGNIAENYVDEAVTYSVNKKVAWINWASLAACFSLVVIAILLMHYLSPNIVTPPPTENGELPDGPYVFASADWQIYDSAEALVENADLVFIGKITDIDFQVLDLSNALPVSEKTPDYNRQLYTIYTVEISDTYKGDTTDVTKVRVSGGLVDYKVDEQLSVMEREKAFLREKGIPILKNYHKVKCSIGNSYLFVLKQFETGHPTIMNVDQSIFDLSEPTRKQTVGDNYNVYYVGSKDEDDRPLISAKDVIYEYGRKEWKSFNDKWKKGEYSSAQPEVPSQEATEPFDNSELRAKYPEYYAVCENVRDGVGGGKMGVEVYIWEIADGEYRCGALYQTSSYKNVEQWLPVTKNGATVDEMKTILSLHSIPQKKVSVVLLKKTGMTLYEKDNEVDYQTVQEIFWGN